MKLKEWDSEKREICEMDCSETFGYTPNSYNFSCKSRSNQEEIFKNKPTLLEALCNAFQRKSCSLNSPFYKLDQTEFYKVLNSLAFYKSCLPFSESTKWCVEFGETSNSCTSVVEASKGQLVCYVLGQKFKVIGKLMVKNAEKKLIIPKIYPDGNSNLQLLKNMKQLSSASIKDRYNVPNHHTKLSDVGHSTASRLQLYGVVTAVNKVPTKTKASWHSLLCISDPSLINTDSEENEDLPPTEFKMHFFLPSLEDHPEIHRGDVVRFTNVKIESHQNRCDGRVFSKSDITVFCLPDSKAECGSLENSEERSAVVRVLSQWWALNHRYFDYLTPHPIYHLHSRYPGVRLFKELSNQLVCDLYCQVVNMSDDSSELNFLCVRDGSIFTLKDRPKPDETVPEMVPSCDPKDKPSFGYLALVVFESNPWKKIKALKITVNDFIYMREVKTVFLTEEALSSAKFPFRHPFLLLRPAVDHIKKLPPSHHEAHKIRSRLHRLPEELERMTDWKFPPPAVDEEPEDPFLTQLTKPSVQINLLKRLKRF